MSKDDPMSVVRRYLEALRRRDAEAMYAELDPHVVLDLPTAPEGMPKQVVGKAAFMEFFGPIDAGLWADITFPTLEVRAEADPERVLAEYTSHGTFSNGRPYANTYVNLCRVRGGKIVETREFFNPIPLMAGLVPLT